ncbi:Pycsar system effector family protein [Candidatus Venteria ishoeyi]|uniref:Pycsar effector protein domain-containing protein n=1 Tax=Candidatus Venteria ishoeyi TaxID=1899563 RepID=A0A1H6FEC6_9GAMM|nr:Pycsar system effector family protein [Candidatus Venteria ishoeyi]SEH08397.1 Uncharacterised protein [Candidatus Venteria ishoeyi]
MSTTSSQVINLDPPSSPLADNIEDTAKALKKTKLKNNKKNSKIKIKPKLAELESASGRSIDSMYRNAYRTQLDLIRLADNKSNIMISINGLILSVIVTAWAMIKNHTEAIFFIPISIFILSSLFSMFFSVLAARPKKYCSSAQFDDFAKKKANLMFFYDQVSLSADEYVRAVDQACSSNEHIYNHMSRHIYRLGLVITSKFKLLNMAYSLFIYGLCISVLSFLLIEFNLIL